MNLKLHVSEKSATVYNIAFLFAKNVLEKLYAETSYNLKDNVSYLSNNVWLN